MQRPNSGEHSSSSFGLQAQGSGTMYAGQPAALPGQIILSPSAARTWPTLVELVNALKRRLVLATFLGVLVGMAAAAGVWLAMPAGKHQVRGLLQIKPNAQMVGKNAGVDPEFESFKETQKSLIKGRRLVEKVYRDPKVAQLHDIRTADDPLRYLEESIRIRMDSPELMAVSMNGDDPKQLKVILDTILDEFVKDAESAEDKERAERRRAIQEQMAKIQRDIKAHEDSLDRATEMNFGADVDSNHQKQKLLADELATVYREISDAKKLIEELKIDQIGLAAKLKDLDTNPLDAADLEKAARYHEDVKATLDERDAQRTKVDKLSKTLNPESTILKTEKDRLKKLEDDGRAAIEKVRASVEADVRKELKKPILSQIEAAKSKQSARELILQEREAAKKKTEQELTDTRRATKVVRQDNDALKPKREQLAILETSLLQLDLADKVEPRIQKREDAVVILNQNLRQKVLLAAAAFVIGLGLIMAAVAFLEWRSRRVDSVDQVVNELGLRVIGTIPAFPSKASLRSGDPLQAQNWRFVLNESVNSARTMLLHAAKTQNMQVLMVSSAMQGEGKTSLASQLATSMATAGLRTLVLDCDLRNPSMHKLFDSPLSPGCAEILLQEIDVSDAVQPTTVPNLWLIPAGQCSNRVISALAQGNPLETLFNRLRGQFDFIVVDTCPILPVADALLVGQHVDGVVMSVLQDISQLPKVLTASEKLTQLNIPLLGAVMNGVKPDVHAYGYNYVKQLPA
jgi:capsular exopolysaccharide synthesis family protein